MRRLGMLLLAVGLVLGLGCASKKLTLHPVTSNVFSVEGFPTITVVDDYKFVGCENFDQGPMQIVGCRFMKQHVGAQGGSIYMTVSSSAVLHDDFPLDTSLKNAKHTVEFEGRTYNAFGHTVDTTYNKYGDQDSQEVVRQERLDLFEIIDSNKAQLFMFNVDMDVLPREPRDDAATLELMLGLMDQAIVSIEP